MWAEACQSLMPKGRFWGGRPWVERDVHHGGAHVAGGYDAVALALHGLGEQAKGLAYLTLFLRGDVVLLCELRLARLRRIGGGFPLRGLSGKSLSSRLQERVGETAGERVVGIPFWLDVCK